MSRNQDQARRDPRTNQVTSVIASESYGRSELEHVSGPLWRDELSGNFFLVTAYDTSPISVELIRPSTYGSHEVLKIRVRHIAEGASIEDVRLYLGRVLRWIWNYFGNKRYHVMLNLVGLPQEQRRPFCDAFLTYFHQQGRASFVAVSALWNVGELYWVEATEDPDLPFKAELDFIGTPKSLRLAIEQAGMTAAA